MIISISKFGYVLNSRQSGKEAYAAFLPVLSTLKEGEPIMVDFAGIGSFSTSWGDEFLTPLQKQFGDRITLKNTQNASVALTVSMLERINGCKFRVE